MLSFDRFMTSVSQARSYGTSDGRSECGQINTDARIGRGFASQVARDIVLTDTECAALASVDGTQAQPELPSEVESPVPDRTPRAVRRPAVANRHC